MRERKLFLRLMYKAIETALNMVLLDSQFSDIFFYLLHFSTSLHLVKILPLALSLICNIIFAFPYYTLHFVVVALVGVTGDGDGDRPQHRVYRPTKYINFSSMQIKCALELQAVEC